MGLESISPCNPHITSKSQKFTLRRDAKSFESVQYVAYFLLICHWFTVELLSMLLFLLLLMLLSVVVDGSCC